MRLLWLKVYASGVDDAPLDAARVLERDGRDSRVVRSSDRDGEDANDEPAWNVKSAPRTIAPWTTPSPRARELEAASTNEEELPPVG